MSALSSHNLTTSNTSPLAVSPLSLKDLTLKDDDLELVVMHHLPEGMEVQSRTIISISEKVERLTKPAFSKIAILTLKYVGNDFRERSCSKKALQTLIMLGFPGLLIPLSTLTSYASINLLYNSDFSQAFSSDIDTRVGFANTTTNAGALLACITDLPAITYLLYLVVVKNAYQKAMHNHADESFHALIERESAMLTPEMHEEIYQQHIGNLQSLDVEKFYSRPDPLSKTGKMHLALASELLDIDREISQGVSLRALVKNFAEPIKQGSCCKKIIKVTVGAVCGTSLLCMQAFSVFLMIENGILVCDTPVRDLFSQNRTVQLNEAFYLTQIGGVFSALTAFGAATYISYSLFLRKAYKKTISEKIRASFANRFNGLSNPVRMALYRIMEIKLKRANS